MPKHTWSSSITTDAGSASTSDKIDIYGSGEQNIGGDALAVATKGLPVGPSDVVKVTRSIKVANVKSFFIKSTTAMRVRTNSETSPAQEFELAANKALAWNNQNVPQPSSNPLTVDITDFYFFNHDAVNIAYVKAGFLDDTDSVTS